MIIGRKKRELDCKHAKQYFREHQKHYRDFAEVTRDNRKERIIEIRPNYYSTVLSTVIVHFNIFIFIYNIKFNKFILTLFFTEFKRQLIM